MRAESFWFNKLCQPAFVLISYPLVGERVCLEASVSIHVTDRPTLISSAIPHGETEAGLCRCILYLSCGQVVDGGGGRGTQGIKSIEVAQPILLVTVTR